MNKTRGVLIVGFLVLSLGFTGCSFFGLNPNKQAEESIQKEESKPSLEYLYDNSVAIHNVSDSYSKSLPIKPEILATMPLKDGDRELSQEDREAYARTTIEVTDIRNLLDKYIQTLYSVNPDNAEEKCKLLADISYESTKPLYKNIIQEIKTKKIIRNYKTHKMDRSKSVDVKILSSGKVIPGKVVAGIVNYTDANGIEKEDNIEFHILNINDNWQVASFRIVQ
jgi:hypothetical protein